MSKKFQVSKFKNAAPKIPKKETWISNINAGRLMQSYGNHIAASTNYMVFNTQDCGVGSVVVLPLNHEGRISQQHCIRGHGDFVSDFEFSPFDDNLLVTGSYDGTLKVWQLPDEITEDLSEASIILPTTADRIDILAWHPAARGILAVTTQQTIKIWDVEEAKAKLELSAGDQVQSMSWRSNGRALVTSCRDKMIRIYDPRQQDQSAEWEGHDNARDSRVLWVGDTERIVSTGFATNQDRSLFLWDMRKTNSPLESVSGGTSTGVLIPLFDESTNMLFVSGKGDRSIRYFEIADSNSIKENSSSTCEQVKGLCLVPKLAMQVMDCEVNRILVLSKDNIVPMPYHVPRKSYREFHSDLYPDILAHESAMTAQQWLSGDNDQVKRMSMDPSKPTPSTNEKSHPTCQLDVQTSSRTSSAEKDQARSSESPPVIGQSILKPTNSFKEPKAPSQSPPLFPGQSILRPVAARSEPANSDPANNPADNLMPDRSILRPVFKSVDDTETDQALVDGSFGDDNSKFASAKTTFLRLENRDSFRRNGHLTGDENGNSDCSGRNTPIRGSGRKFKGFRMCKFRHLEGKVMHRSMHIENIRNLSQNVTGESDGFVCNAQRCAVPLKGNSGLVAVLEFSKPGRLSDTFVPCVENGSKVLDFVLDPYDETRLVCACDDGAIRIWRVPDGGFTRTETEPEMVIAGHIERLYFVKYHPLARDVMTSVSFDMTVKIWDMATQTCQIELEGHTDNIFCLSWSPDGRFCATACKDGKLRIYEPRKSTKPIREGDCEKNRGGRLVWACAGQYVIYCCFAKQNNRMVQVYKSEDLTQIVATQEVGATPAILVPVYDEDSSTLFLIGRGEASVFTYEVSTEHPHLFPMSTWKADSLHQSLGFLTKNHCDVRGVEFAKAYRLTASTVEPVSFSVPRIKAEHFQDDLFPETRPVWKPTITSSEWFSGSDKQPGTVSLKPADMKNLSEVAATDSPKPKPKYDSYSTLGFKTDDEKKEELVTAMMGKMTAARRDSDKNSKPRSSVTDDDWDD